jgi:hypothetical protein
MSESNSRYCLFRAIHWEDRPLANIFTKHASSFLPAMAALTMQSAPAIAQDQPRTQLVKIFGGEIFGDELTEAPISGRNPRLSDDGLAGTRYNYNFTDMWGTQLSSGYSWNRASRVPGGENKLGVETIDFPLWASVGGFKRYAAPAFRLTSDWLRSTRYG